jgi:hypothetical protein
MYSLNFYLIYTLYMHGMMIYHHICRGGLSGWAIRPGNFVGPELLDGGQMQTIC